MHYILCFLSAFLCLNAVYRTAASPVLLMKNEPYLSVYKRQVISSSISTTLQKRQNVGGKGYGAAFVKQANAALKGVKSGLNKFVSSFRSSETGSKLLTKTSTLVEKFKGTGVGQSTINTYSRVKQFSPVVGIRNDLSRFSSWAGSKGKALVNRISQW